MAVDTETAGVEVRAALAAAEVALTLGADAERKAVLRFAGAPIVAADADTLLALVVDGAGVRARVPKEAPVAVEVWGCKHQMHSGKNKPSREGALCDTTQPTGD